ncbi:MAG TPA: ATP-binding protein [Vicinamibacterales bacterium]|nr:ATP-binding protein [Vicinamibacterales bacterium]
MIPSEKPKILIVDDQPRNLDVLEAMLGDMDCTLVRATSADEALLSLVRNDFAALVLDIKMPGMSGIELATLIKQRKRSQHVPILFLTAHSVNDEDVLKGYGVGAVDYLSKPINSDILRSKVGVFVELFRKTRDLGALNAVLQGEIAERENAQAALELANQDLELRVRERTGALNRAHQGVRENEERLRMALEVAQIAAWEWHLGSDQMQWSTDPEILFAFPKGSFGPELRIFRTVHPQDRPRVEEATVTALKTGTYEAQYRAVRPDGTVVWIKERGRVFPDADGDRMVGISRDVTAEREAAQERERLLRSERAARDEAENQSRLKDEFLATLSHELRTPMNAILGWLSILESGKPIREIHSALAVITRNAQLQAKLIDDLLDMNRLMAGNIQLDVAPVDVATLLQTTMQSLQPAANARGVQMIASVDTNVGEILADARRLQQVLWNLVHNALKFSTTDGRVEIHVQRTGDGLEITVKDNGQGISPSFLPHVFERFRQQDASPTRAVFGLGLGLSIAKHLVELHGGEITAHSAGEGQGARFVVWVPPIPRGSETARGGENARAVEDHKTVQKHATV